jgi:glutamate N-acetyltransferase/amino-acid N-acetyltransferase
MTAVIPPSLAPFADRFPTVDREPILPAGFLAGGLPCGVKASGRPDLALLAARGEEEGAPPPRLAVGAVFTPHPVAAAPVRLSRRHLASTGDGSGGSWGWARAVVAVSGCANAATGPAGDADQLEVARLVAAALGIPLEEVLCLATGVIGTRLPVERIATGLAQLVPAGLRSDDAGLAAAAAALLTTDTRTKVATTVVSLPLGDGAPIPVRLTGIAKGVGMIHPRMATMLAVLLTDAPVRPQLLATILRRVTARTWNQLTIDGDTSTNDTVFLLASGRAGGRTMVADRDQDADVTGPLTLGVEAVARDLARQQAADGEGATTLLTCQVSGGRDDAEARAVARAVVASSLVKAAIHGRDPNWGRVVAAAGNAHLPDAAVLEAAGLDRNEATARAGEPVALDPARLRVAIAGHLVYDGTAGGPQPVDRAAARAAMVGPEVVIRLDLGLGPGRGEAFGCDLSETYVRENAEYTT